jgi:hypothetical protein
MEMKVQTDMVKSLHLGFVNACPFVNRKNVPKLQMKITTVDQNQYLKCFDMKGLKQD